MPLSPARFPPAAAQRPDAPGLLATLVPLLTAAGADPNAVDAARRRAPPPALTGRDRDLGEGQRTRWCCC